MIICLTGFSCIGKTTISRLYETQEGYSLISTRLISHNLSLKNGYMRTREWLRQTSIDNYLLECRKEFMKQLSNNTQNYIIDDLFDIILWNDIKNKYKSVLISMSLPERIRIERMQKREQLNLINAKQELKFLDDWKKMFGIQEVIDSANINLDVSNLSSSEVVKSINQYISHIQ